MSRDEYRCGACGDVGHNARKCVNEPVRAEPGLCRCGAEPEEGKKSCARCLKEARARMQAKRGDEQYIAKARAVGRCEVLGCTNPGWLLKGGKGTILCLIHLPRSHPERKKVCVRCKKRPRARGWKAVDGVWRRTQHRVCRWCWFKHEEEHRRERHDRDQRRLARGQLASWARHRH